MPTVITKSVFASKLFWLGVVQVVLGVIEQMTVQGLLNSDKAGWVFVVTGVLTIVARWLGTEKPVSLRGGEQRYVNGA